MFKQVVSAYGSLKKLCSHFVINKIIDVVIKIRWPLFGGVVSSYVSVWAEMYFIQTVMNQSQQDDKYD